MSFIVYLYFIIPLRHQSNNQRINTIRNESILTFAICLSIAYLLYYGANIGKDLYAAGKQLTSNEEVFDIEDVPVETAVSVNEQGDGLLLAMPNRKNLRKCLTQKRKAKRKKLPRQRDALLRCKRIWTKRT